MTEKISIFEISKKEAKSLSSKIESEITEFWQKHCSNEKDELTIILKCHLFIENCLDDLISLSLPNPKEILERSSFANKITLFDVLNISSDKAITKKLKAINKLRNDYVHNLDKIRTQKEIKWLKGNLGVKSKTFSFKEILANLHYIIGYFHAERTFLRAFPFIGTLKRNKDIIKRDISFIYCYPVLREVQLEFKKVMKELRK